MRALLLASTLVIVDSGAALAATQRAASPVRSVQLISMTERSEVAAGGQDRTAEPSTEVPVEAVVADVEGFRVHDLSRRWVEYQMGERLAAEAGAATAVAEEDPFAPVGVAQLSAPANQTGTLAPFSAIAVPAWMRGGPVFAAAATTFVPGCSPTGYRRSGFLPADAEVRRQTYFSMMSNVACEYGIPVGLFDAMIIRESRYNASAVSPKSAFGLTQLMPGTAAGLGVNRYDVEQNLRGGARYLRQQLDRFGAYHLALAAYNAGPGRVRNGSVPRIVETQDYVSNVLFNWSRLSGVSRVATIQTSASPTPRREPFVRAATVSSF